MCKNTKIFWNEYIKHYLTHEVSKSLQNETEFALKWGLTENGKMSEMPFLEAELQGGKHHSESITATAAEVDGGGFLEIFRRAGDFPDVETGRDDLR